VHASEELIEDGTWELTIETMDRREVIARLPMTKDDTAGGRKRLNAVLMAAGPEFFQAAQLISLMATKKEGATPEEDVYEVPVLAFNTLMKALQYANHPR
jgi:hypothetical protein